MADHNKHQRHDRHHDKHKTYARVVAVEPIYKTVQVSYPEKQCWHEEARKPVKYRVNHVEPEKLILGGIIGGVIGHELGRNHNQELATVTGAVIGTAIAHSANAQYYHDGEYRTQSRKHCRVEHRVRTEQQFEGYRVTYRYKGELYTTRMRNHPGKRIPVNVEVTPERRHHRH
ncbi:MAG: hypothetical protein AMJ53_05380 [Gammaproteobacteria bacterium SG8_11]|nr:MAG: hypothetical protein AMJ53_05380 [Gammaproteobacteria bacterium SG8_11]